MSESEEENHELPPESKPAEEPEYVMDFNLDIESSWPLDQISFFSNPASPFVISTSSEGPFSPLWAFSDVDKDTQSRIAASAFSDCHQYFSCNSSSINGKPKENDENNKLSPPLENPNRYCLIKERMTQALRNFKELTEQNVLAQVWAPVRNGNRYVLTTSGQPFVLDPHSNGLHQYRTVSLTYAFSVDAESDGILGLPSRVFQKKLPEWSPNVKYYSNKEYPRRDHAQHYHVRGTLALPVFEPLGQSCIGVLELITTSQKINYAPEVDKVCKALEAVNLRSSEVLDHPHTQICNEGRQNALAEILEILTVACEIHKLPLAQTWIPCRHRSVLAHGGGLKKSCSSFDGSCMGQVCMSTTDAALYVIDARMWGFREACVEHHLQQGQGVAGKAFLCRNMCFCGNITEFCKFEYPLVHYALMFGLTSCFAVCLRSSHTEIDDYVLEFFLPPEITDFDEQKAVLGSILATMNQHFHSLKIASGLELKEEGSVEIIEATNERVYSRVEAIQIAQSTKSPPRPNASPNVEETVLLDSSELQIMMYYDDTNGGGNLGDNVDQISSLDTKNVRKPLERKRGKTEKSISLEVLQRYFAGSLKDAAKSLGVCPTTMKRICRQHGISRWPSRKINKVNRSLSNLKCVIESVQGAEEAFALNWMKEDTGLNASKVLETNRHVGIEYHLQEGKIPSPKKAIREKGGSTQELGKVSIGSKTGSGPSKDRANHTYHGSCNDDPPNEILSLAKSIFITPNYIEQCVVATETTPDPVVTEPREPFVGMLIEDAGSSKDLRNLCPSVADAMLEDQVPEACESNPHRQCINTICNIATTPFASPKESKGVTIKATYREDIIRFQISLTYGIVELKEEVAKRLKLEVGTFDIKYLDDDHEWVLIACDADLQECMDIKISSGRKIIRVSVYDITSNLGSSCESSGE